MITLNGTPLPPAPDYPFDNAGYYLMHRDRMSNYGIVSMIHGLCLHTPEEPSDNYESTPVFFRQSGANGSVGGTHYYTDSDGEIVQMARDGDQVHAQGVRSSGPNPNVRLPRPPWWTPDLISYNTCMLSNEIEGYASSLHITMPVGGKQWNALVHWCAFKYIEYRLPLAEMEDRIIGHGRLATDRSDPGARFPWADLYRDVRAEIARMTGTEKAPERPASYVVRAGDTLGAIAVRLGVDLDELVRVNGITNPNFIYVGQVLIVPGAATEEPPPPPVEEDRPQPHPMLTPQEAIDAMMIALGYATGPVGTIKDARLQSSFETSGKYAVYRLLVER